MILAAPSAIRVPSAEAQAAGAQREERYHASAYLSLGHWAYPILDYWTSVGRTMRLSPFVKPYRRMDVARVVYDLAGERLYGFEEDWLRRLEEEMEPELAMLVGEAEGIAGLSVSVRGGGAYRSQTHRDPLRPELEGRFSADRVLEHVFLDARGQAGIAVAGVRAGRDGIFLDDPQFPDGRVVPLKELPVLDELGVRFEEAYLGVQTKYASVLFGRLYRNWGAPRLPGFVRSDYAYSEEEIGYRFGVDRLFLIGSVSSLTDFRPDTTRYLSMHRLEARPWDNLVLGATEAVIHGGPSQPLVFSLVNPLAVWNAARTDGDPPKNVVGQIDLWWRPVRGLAVWGSLLADATGRTEENRFCCQMGGSVGVELPTVARGVIVRGRATAIQSLVYRTPLPWEEWSVRRIGLGWDKTDLYLVTLEADWFRRDGLLLRPRLDLQVRGQGDFREPRPTIEELVGFPNVLVGEAETTVRPALAGLWRPNTSVPIDLRWDLGVNFIDDFDHLEGDARTAFVASFRLVAETPPLILPLSN